MGNEQRYTCPVCDYKELDEPPFHSHEICPQCGTQFGYDDNMLTHEQLRLAWIADGSKFWSDRNNNGESTS